MYLDTIVAHHRRRSASDLRDHDNLFHRAAEDETYGHQSFRAALTRAPGLAVIAEIKRATPSTGPLTARPIEVGPLARAYEAGGAACLSVVTDGFHFEACQRDLPWAKEQTALPALRKDFIVSVNDICDSALMGADAVLLIAAVLTDAEISWFTEIAEELGMETVVEVHTETEAQRAIDAGAEIIGINQRDLTTFEIDPERAARIRTLIPAGTTVIAESGIDSPAAAAGLAAAGFDAALIGTYFVTAPDPEAAVAGIVAAGT
jgi:indole-3-glycerol phosphate synthase